MNENFLHYVWQHRRFDFLNAKTTTGVAISVISPGVHNFDAGPDFSHSVVEIGDVRWVGNVEIHVSSSDWYKHRHQYDEKYDSVILHVVYDCDTDVCLSNGELLPTLQLKDYIDPAMFERYRNLYFSPDPLSCRAYSNSVDSLVFQSQMSHSLMERLLKRQKKVFELLSLCGHDWSEVVYRFLAQSFGCKTNSAAFEALSQHLPYRILQRHSFSFLQVEALLFGVAGFLSEKFDGDEYPQRLCYEYDYLSYKYQLTPMQRHLWNFLRLRPQNFPTLRIAQFSSLMFATKQHLKEMVLEASFNELSRWLAVDAGEYWENHYCFGKTAPRHKAFLGPQTIDAIIINTIIPIRFSYAKFLGDDLMQERAVALYDNLPFENNKITRIFRDSGFSCKNAADSQAQLELFDGCCVPKKCLKCSVGEKIIRDLNKVD